MEENDADGEGVEVEDSVQGDGSGGNGNGHVEQGNRRPRLHENGTGPWWCGQALLKDDTIVIPPGDRLKQMEGHWKLDCPC